MNPQIITTNEYLIIVDNSEINSGDIVLVNNEFHNNSIRTFTTVFGGKEKDCKRIIAHLPLNNNPILKDIDLISEDIK